MSRTRATLTALTLIPTLLVAGCSDDDPKPKFEPPPSEAPSSASTSPTPAAEDLDPLETWSAWVDARNVALRSGDTTEVEALSAPSCRTCQNAITPIAEVYESGGHFETEGWKVVASRVKSQSDDSAKISAGIEYAAGETVPSAGADPVVYGLERHIVAVTLAKIDGQWRVKFIGYLS